MRTIFYPDMYARHDLIIESAGMWLEDVIQFKSVPLLSVADEARAIRTYAVSQLSVVFGTLRV